MQARTQELENAGRHARGRRVRPLPHADAASCPPAACSCAWPTASRCRARRCGTFYRTGDLDALQGRAGRRRRPTPTPPSWSTVVEQPDRARRVRPLRARRLADPAPAGRDRAAAAVRRPEGLAGARPGSLGAPRRRAQRAGRPQRRARVPGLPRHLRAGAPPAAHASRCTWARPTAARPTPRSRSWPPRTTAATSRRCACWRSKAATAWSAAASPARC